MTLQRRFTVVVSVATHALALSHGNDGVDLRPTGRLRERIDFWRSIEASLH